MASNTDQADINEILLGYFLAGSKWTSLGNDAKKQHDTKAKLLTDDEYKQQSGRAEVMAKDVIVWAKANGYKGSITKVWWTARPGSLSEAVERTVDQRKNPTDILIKYSSGPANGFLGISAKSTKGKTDIGFKNPGLGTVEKALQIQLKIIDDKAIAAVIKKFDLPASADARKQMIRKNPHIQAKTEEMGKKVLSDIRDKFLTKLLSLKPKELMDYILTYWVDSSSELYPPYIKATGMGSKPPFTSKVDDPLKNDKLTYLTTKKITLSKVGNESIGVKAGDKQILKMRVKYESEKLASSVKLSGDPW